MLQAAVNSSYNSPSIVSASHEKEGPDWYLPIDLWNIILKLLSPEEQPPLKEVCRRWREFVTPTSKLGYKLPKYAIKAGNIALFIWCKERKFPIYPWVCDVAARNGRLDTLQALRGMEYPLAETSAIAAARGGNLQILQFLHSRTSFPDTLCDEAARSGSLEVVTWLRASNFSLNVETAMIAAQEGHLDLLKYLYREGCPFPKDILNCSAKSGNLEMLKWLHAQGYKIEENTLFVLAKTGNLDAVKWVHAHGGTWELEDVDQDCSWEAAYYGHLHILQWAIESGCGISFMCFRGAVLGAQFHILEWGIRERLIALNELCLFTLTRLHSEKACAALQWMHAKGWVTETMFDTCRTRFATPIKREESVLKTIEEDYAKTRRSRVDCEKKRALDLVGQNKEGLKLLLKLLTKQEAQEILNEVCKTKIYRDWLLREGFLT